MSGSKEGGLKCKSTLLDKLGADGYKAHMAFIGSLGGRNGNTGGFAAEEVGSDGLTGRERAREAGRKGGRISKRRKKL